MLAFATAHWPQIAAGVVVLLLGVKLAYGAGWFSGWKWPTAGKAAEVPLRDDLDALLGILGRAKKRAASSASHATCDAVGQAVECVVKELTA